MSQQQPHPINDFTASALQNLRTLVDVNTIVGDPITTAEGIVIIPISKVSFGYGTGGSDLPFKTSEGFGAGTGGGVTIQPLAFLVISGGRVELLQMQTADNTADRIVNSVPGLIDKVTDLFKKEKPSDKKDSQA
ncbi:GerW family sporulation protein [Oscillospiraceae bacterium MB08-C2-2]|nr:GerW family sporulation protein [Oscillospiraceae bacterium MB08-C2-2]